MGVSHTTMAIPENSERNRKYGDEKSDGEIWQVLCIFLRSSGDRCWSYACHQGSDNVGLIGHFARIGPNLLVTDDLAFLRRTTAPRSGYTRGEWYDGVKLYPDLNNVISERNEARHADIRAKLANGVSILPLNIL